MNGVLIGMPKLQAKQYAASWKYAEIYQCIRRSLTGPIEIGVGLGIQPFTSSSRSTMWL